jgi:hypothetical protein
VAEFHAVSALTLPEEFLVLALDADRGTVRGELSGELAPGLAGAALMELALAERVRIEDGKVVPVGEGALGDPVLDPVLEKVVSSKRRRGLTHWVTRFGSYRGLEKRCLERLLEKGVLRRGSRRVLLVIPRTAYLLADPSPREEVLGRILSAGTDETTDVRATSLAAVGEACGIAKRAMADEDYKAAKRRLKSLAKEDEIARSVADVIGVAATTAAVPGVL